MLQAVIWVTLAGGVARFFLSDQKPGLVVTFLTGLGGCLLGYLVGHELLQIHDFHLFEAESLIPAVIGSVVLLAAIQRATRTQRRRTLFS